MESFQKKIIKQLCDKNIEAQELGYGPFSAAIVDHDNNILLIAHNSVVLDNCSLHHAEINVIKAAQEKFKTYDLSPYNLSIYITAEPCSMCVGAIMWAGIKNIYFGTPSKDVEKITGFDEGYKPEWIKYFKQKDISVKGNIENEYCKKVLNNYINADRIIYKTSK